MATDDRLEMAQFEYRGSTTLSFYRIGTALGAALHAEPARYVSDVVLSQVIEELRERADDHRFSKHSPFALAPRAALVPAALAALELTELDREYAPYVHQRVRFTFEDERPVAQAMAELGSALAEDGWHESWGRIVQGESSVLIADRGGARLTVGKWPRPAWAVPSLQSDGVVGKVEPAVVSASHYLATLELRFDREELEAVAARAADEPLDVSTLLVLRRFLNDDQRTLLRASLRAHPRPDAHHWMALSRLHEQAGDPESARAALRTASALARIDHGSSLRSAIDTRARELGLASADLRAGPTLDQLLDAGCLVLEAATDPTSVSLETGGSVRFAAQGGDGSVSVLSVRFRSLEADDPITVRTWEGGGRLQRSVGIGEQTAVWLGSSPCELEGSALEDGRLQLQVRRTR